MDFISIDFETANGWNRASACAIGITQVKNGEIVNEYYSLINPKDDFDYFNIGIHGITPEMVVDKPNFAETWDEIQYLFNNNLVVAHNASFDMSVLRYCLRAYNLPFPDFNYACSYLLSKQILQRLSNYKLNTVYEYLDLGRFNHHNALEDSRAAAQILINLLQSNETDDVQTLSKKHGYTLGVFMADSNSYKPFSSKKYSSGFKVSDITTSVQEFDEDHSFYNKSFTFTGTLNSMTRKEAMQKVVDVGGVCTSGVTLKTNYLVIGVQDYSKFKDGTKSSKMKKAEKYAQDGLDIEIITEDDFIEFL